LMVVHIGRGRKKGKCWRFGEGRGVNIPFPLPTKKNRGRSPFSEEGGGRCYLFLGKGGRGRAEQGVYGLTNGGGENLLIGGVGVSQNGFSTG